MRKTLIYILGTQRSGTTALEYVLSTHADICALGEVRLLEHYAAGDPDYVLSEAKCTCGTAASECPFWSEVVLQPCRTQGIPVQTNPSQHAAAERDQLTRCLRAVFQLAGDATDRILVDSSKDLAYLEQLMAALPDWHIFVVHVLRHPFAVAGSQNKWRLATGKRRLPDVYLVKKWFDDNRAHRDFLRRSLPDRHVTVVHEQFASEPMSMLRDIAAGVGITDEFETATNLRALHTIGGTPSRFERDTFELVPAKPPAGALKRIIGNRLLRLLTV